MKYQQLLLVLSTMIMVSNCEEGSCRSVENPKKIPGTVQDHLKSTVRTLWKEEILKEQTNDIKVVLNNALLERDSKIEGIEGQLAQKDQQINEMKTQLQTSNTQMKNHFEGQLAQKDQQISQLANIVNQLANTVNELQALQVPKIIFNAEKTDGEFAFTGLITFNRVTLNVGNAMSSDGFVAPIAGHYKLSFSANGGWEKHGINTYVWVSKNGSRAFRISDSNDGSESHGNNISHDWIWKLNKGDKVTFRVISDSYLRAQSSVPLNFNGELVYMEA